MNIGGVIPAVTLAAGVFLSAPACDKQTSADPYVARIGESVLTREDLSTLLPDYIASDTAGATRNAIRTWARRELLYQQAIREGLHKDSKLKGYLDEYRKTLFGNTFLDMYLADQVGVTTDDVRDYYTRNRDQFRRKRPEAALLHFLFETEKEALQVKGKLLRSDGSVRQELLNTYQIHAQMVSQGTLIPPLNRAVFGPGEPRGVLGPIRSEYGFHLLEVLEYYPADSFRGLDQVYDDISQLIFRERSAVQYELLLDSLMVKTPLKIHPDFSGLFP